MDNKEEIELACSEINQRHFRGKVGNLPQFLTHLKSDQSSSRTIQPPIPCPRPRAIQSSQMSKLVGSSLARFQSFWLCRAKERSVTAETYLTILHSYLLYSPPSPTSLEERDHSPETFIFDQQSLSHYIRSSASLLLKRILYQLSRLRACA